MIIIYYFMVVVILLLFYCCYYNIEGGRCEECQGEGIIRVEMQFMADEELTCENCKGMRFRIDILEFVAANLWRSADKGVGIGGFHTYLDMKVMV
jgi:hypothetical protein